MVLSVLFQFSQRNAALAREEMEGREEDRKRFKKDMDDMETNHNKQIEEIKEHNKVKYYIHSHTYIMYISDLG